MCIRDSYNLLSTKLQYYRINLLEMYLKKKVLKTVSRKTIFLVKLYSAQYTEHNKTKKVLLPSGLKSSRCLSRVTMTLYACLHVEN